MQALIFENDCIEKFEIIKEGIICHYIMVNVISVFHVLFNSFVCLQNIVIDDCKNFSSLITIVFLTKFLTVNHETNRVHCED